MIPTWSVAQLACFILISYGLTFMLKDALLFKGLRAFLKGDRRLLKWARAKYDKQDSSDQPDEEYVDDFDEYLALVVDEFERSRRERFFDELLGCSFCVGTWSGIFLAFWGVRAHEVTLHSVEGLGLLASFALMSAVIGFVGDPATQWLEEQVS